MSGAWDDEAAQWGREAEKQVGEIKVKPGTQFVMMRRPCPTCGNGNRERRRRCPTCKGKGVIGEAQAVAIKFTETTEEVKNEPEN